MEVQGYNLIEDFCKKHADAMGALAQWLEYVECAKWTNHNELKASFPSADYVGNKRYVFNIKGNSYRLILLATFFAGRVDIRYIGTHAEYDRINKTKDITKI